MDNNGIYNNLTQRPLKTFNDLLSKVDEFSRVEDDDKATMDGRPIPRM